MTKIKVVKIMTVFDRVEIIVGKRQKGWFPAFFPFFLNVFKKIFTQGH